MTDRSAEPVATVVNGHTFTIDTRYVLKDSRILGKGSFGVVCTAYDSVRRIDIAIKRIRPYANDEWDAKHTLREIRLLRLLGPHPNIVTLYEMSLYEPKTELYMMMELMDCDLHRVIQSKQPLSEKHHKCFIKQILEAIKAMHSVGVYHRDLKPGNILVSKDCQVRIADFGLARFMDEDEAGAATDYVVTRWYRCPELLLTKNYAYSAAIDMWSVGCILAELLRRQPLFPGKSHTEQVQLIFQCFGYNSGENLGFPVSEEALGFLEKRCRYRKVAQPLRKSIPNASDEAMQLVEALLTIDPVHRPDAEQALDYPFLQGAEILNDYSKNYVRQPAADYFDFEKGKQSVAELKRLIELEVQAIAANGYRFNKFSNQASPDNYPMSDDDNSPYSAQTNSGLISSHSQRDMPQTSGSDGGDGPASQLPTQVRNVRATSGTTRTGNNHASNPSSSSHNPYASARNASAANANANHNALNPYASRLQQGQAGKAATAAVDRMELTDEDGYDQPSAAVLADDARRQLAKVLQNNHDGKTYSSADSDYGYGPSNAANILTAVRNEVGPPGTRGRKSVPKTPSPKKMDMIIQKDINNRQRFAAQNQTATAEARSYRASFPANPTDSTVNQPPRRASAVNPYSSAASSSSVSAGVAASDNSSRRKLGPFPVLSRISNALTGRSSSSQAENSAVDKRINSMLGGGRSSGGDSYQQQYELNRSAAMMHSGSNVIHNADSYHNNSNPYSSGYPYRK